LLHVDEQHSPSRLHTSPVCTQNDAPRLQWPSSQSCEQHSLLLPHSLPLVLQLVFSGLHLPASQFPPQHSASTAQLAPSDMQVESEHCPEMQPSEQHSVEVVQLAAAGEHCATVELQLCVCASHKPEQQSFAS
jgi:hypothetical protein